LPPRLDREERETLIQYRPSPTDLLRLKTPIGRLLAGEPRDVATQLASLVRQVEPPRVITVGDIVSREALEVGIRVNLRIVDRKTMRQPLNSPLKPSPHTYRVRNPPGVITDESLKAIRQAMKDEEALIVVEGEEDLLALPAVLEAPAQAFVIYGQPLQGIVVIVTTASVKAEVEAIIGRMAREAG